MPTTSWPWHKTDSTDKCKKANSIQLKYITHNIATNVQQQFTDFSHRLHCRHAVLCSRHCVILTAYSLKLLRSSTGNQIISLWHRGYAIFYAANVHTETDKYWWFSKFNRTILSLENVIWKLAMQSFWWQAHKLWCFCIKMQQSLMWITSMWHALECEI